MSGDLKKVPRQNRALHAAFSEQISDEELNFEMIDELISQGYADTFEHMKFMTTKLVT